MKTPKDQPLFFIVFFAITFSLTAAAWLVLPAHVKQEEEGAEESHPKKILKGKEAMVETEAVLAKADEILTRLEKTQKTDKTKDAKTKDGKGKDESTKDGKTPKPPDKKSGPDDKVRHL